MRKRSIILIATFLSLGIVGSAAAYYRHHGGYGHDRYGSHFTKHIEQNLAEKLALNETQKVELSQLTQSLMTTLMAGRKSFEEQRIFDLNEIFSLFEADKFDQEKALKMVRERLSMIESYAEEMILSASGFTDSLTSEQRGKLKEIIEQRMSKRHHHGHNQESHQQEF